MFFPANSQTGSPEVWEGVKNNSKHQRKITMHQFVKAELQRIVTIVEFYRVCVQYQEKKIYL